MVSLETVDFDFEKLKSFGVRGFYSYGRHALMQGSDNGNQNEGAI